MEPVKDAINHANHAQMVLLVDVLIALLEYWNIKNFVYQNAQKDISEIIMNAKNAMIVVQDVKEKEMINVKVVNMD